MLIPCNALNVLTQYSPYQLIPLIFTTSFKSINFSKMQMSDITSYSLIRTENLQSNDNEACVIINTLVELSVLNTPTVQHNRQRSLIELSFSRVDSNERSLLRRRCHGYLGG